MVWWQKVSRKCPRAFQTSAIVNQGQWHRAATPSGSVVYLLHRTTTHSRPIAPSLYPRPHIKHLSSSVSRVYRKYNFFCYLKNFTIYFYATDYILSAVRFKFKNLNLTAGIFFSAKINSGRFNWNVEWDDWSTIKGNRQTDVRIRITTGDNWSRLITLVFRWAYPLPIY